jgi:hypothetical protein
MEELIYSIDWEQVKNSFDIFMWGDPDINVVKAEWITAAVALIGLAISGAQAIKANKRRKEWMQDYEAQKAKFQSQKITNPYEDLSNPYEDLTVNQQQAKFLGQQQQQGLATATRSLRGAAGSSGAQVLAQSIANQQSRNLQGISAMLGQQEAANEKLTAGGEMQLNMAQAQGEVQQEVRQAQKTATLMGMAQAGMGAEQQRLDAAVSNVAYSVGALAGGVQSGVQGAKLNTQMKGNEATLKHGGQPVGGWKRSDLRKFGTGKWNGEWVGIDALGGAGAFQNTNPLSGVDKVGKEFKNPFDKGFNISDLGGEGTFNDNNNINTLDDKQTISGENAVSFGFPANPTYGMVHTVGNRYYSYNGTGWAEIF